ncbi:DUF397 domain-containing protein [Streptomyces sp. JJ66]|uniref:DUF397 domain-containing protein n=1 Tax=Streptomyces sp. JJ66 TaxID=2803843 RepID=UPI001C55CB3E|nr:DUF397 domain-containing protein [Streptomyces sp. JJ66]MBW1603125.1 DUF397 domain-containing protein [Streptomyces sp. JJ66]
MQATNEWFKSSYSAQNGDCLEARYAHHGIVELRDSKNEGGSVVTLNSATWVSFTTALGHGTLGA